MLISPNDMTHATTRPLPQDEQIFLKCNFRGEAGNGRLVFLLGRDHATDAATRILHVSLVARDQVDVQVHHRLASRGSAVGSDIDQARN